ncbi:MAG: hypothetical protein ABIY55_32565 [Kofleriaceae bacterium]
MSDSELNEGKTLWNSGAGGPSAFDDLEAPDNLDEIVREVAQEARARAAERVKPYLTPVTAATLRYPVK